MSAVQQALIATVGLAFVFRPVLSTNQTNYNLRAAAVAAGWNQLTPLIADVTINSGVYVSANSTGTPAFDTGVTFPAGSRLSLTNNGLVVGMGGNGGYGSYTPNNVGAGASGGLALRAQYPITINNTSGTIGGGGGGGGGGCTGIVAIDSYGNNGYTGGGGGGGGRSGATNSSGGGPGVQPYGSGAAGGSGTSAAPGSGGGGGSGAGSGGAGGQWGAAGSSGQSTGWSGGGGGAAGAAVNGNINITWVNTGTRLGAIA